MVDPGQHGCDPADQHRSVLRDCGGGHPDGALLPAEHQGPAALRL